jgi:hypothetical protein
MARGFIFQQESARPQFYLEVTEYLTRYLFGLGEADLTPLDFCLWRYVKDAVYVPPSNDSTLITTRITDAIAQVDTNTQYVDTNM